MSLFDVSKLTPLPNYVLKALEPIPTREPIPIRETIPIAKPVQVRLPVPVQVPERVPALPPILSPLPPLQTVLSPQPTQPIRPTTTQPPSGTVQLPPIPQTQQFPAIPDQPTLPVSPIPRPGSQVLAPGPRPGSQVLAPGPKLPTVTAPVPKLPIVTAPVPKLPTVTAPISPEAQQRFTQELQLAPLSPRSPRFVQKVPAVIIHPVQPMLTETCCICYDEEIPTTNLLTCKHPVCGECTRGLQTPECPVCKRFLEGPLVTDDILAVIINRQEQARMNEMTANYLAGLYLEEHPEANPEEVYERYRN